jgi:PHB/PHA accumulation regulator DNA-binding domain
MVRKRTQRRNRELPPAAGISPFSTGGWLRKLAFHDRIDGPEAQMSNHEQLPILIKLYPNRRLYDGEMARYRGLDELRAWRERQVPFLIVDSKTGDDVTDGILS